MIKDAVLYNDRILGVRISESLQTEAGILLSESKNPYSDRVVVIKVGPGLLTEKGDRLPIVTKPGDYVQVQPMAGMDVIIDGEKYVLFTERDIMIKFVDDESAPENLKSSPAFKLAKKLNETAPKLKVVSDDFIEDSAPNSDIPVQGSVGNYEQETIKVAKYEGEAVDESKVTNESGK